MSLHICLFRDESVTCLIHLLRKDETFTYLTILDEQLHIVGALILMDDGMTKG